MSLPLRRYATRRRAASHVGSGGLLDMYAIQSKVMITDQDVFGHMTNTRYTAFADLALLNLLIRSGAQTVLNEHGWRVRTAREEALFHGMLRFPDAFRVTSRCVGWRGSQVCFEHVFSKKDRDVADIRSVIQTTAPSGERVAADALVSAMGAPLTSPALDEAFLALLG